MYMHVDPISPKSCTQNLKESHYNQRYCDEGRDPEGTGKRIDVCAIA